MQKKTVDYGVVFMLILLCVGLAGCKSASFADEKQGAYQVVDYRGTVVEMPGKPQRIVTLSACTDGIILGMLPTERLAAINSLLDDPVSSNIVGKANKIPAKIRNPSAEQIVALRPDLVIVPDWSGADVVATLRDIGLKVVVCKGPCNVEDVRETIQLLAKAIDEEEQGSRLLAAMEQKLEEIQGKVRAIPAQERKTVVLISLMPSYGGSGCMFDDMCNYANVVNGIAAAGIQNGQVLSKEQLVAVNPDVLILPAYRDHGTYDVESFRRKFLQDPSLQTLKAVRGKRFYVPREGYTYNCSQDMVFGIQEVAYAAYGESFAQPADCHLSVSGENE
ncbi:MAG: ABC transporter substrate-binding protein [Veillonellales bacterium]